MLWRRSRTKRARRAVAGRLPSTEEVRDQVAEMTDDLGEALEAARDAIAQAMTSAGRRGAEAGAEATRKGAVLGKEASRKGMVAGKEAGRRARDAARGAAREVLERRLPEPEQVAELTRRATDKLFPEHAKQRRKANRRRRRRLLLGGAGLAGLGVLAGWLTAPKKGDEVRQTLKERANAAGDKVAEMRASAASPGPAATAAGTDAGSGAQGSAADTGGGAAGSGATTGSQGSPTQQSAEVTPIHQGDGSSTSKRR